MTEPTKRDPKAYALRNLRWLSIIFGVALLFGLVRGNALAMIGGMGGIGWLMWAHWSAGR